MSSLQFFTTSFLARFLFVHTKVMAQINEKPITHHDFDKLSEV